MHTTPRNPARRLEGRNSFNRRGSWRRCSVKMSEKMVRGRGIVCSASVDLTGGGGRWGLPHVFLTS